jgi:hypothetical protein
VLIFKRWCIGGVKQARRPITLWKLIDTVQY